MRVRVPLAPAQWIDELCQDRRRRHAAIHVQGRSILDKDNHGQSPRISTGVPGADHLLHGGFLTGRACPLAGGPGTGKKTLGLHFLAPTKHRQGFTHGPRGLRRIQRRVPESAAGVAG
ncbi:ATPase domain-containing protein [Aquisalimonas sp.]|uniref:ATPase domain-containing protein n=1 Tax=Aquisalimonas sp. TaxID=1872621 RepID=UPI0025C6FE10|nr:ATPase domain-containing protein [Aquisalimonas sp.]